MQGVDRSPGDPFRPDLEGLRGVAILLVLAFHAGLPYVGGGFVGVDVFFVLSGFFITGLLLRERQRTGRVGLRAFYARRARRILPAAAVVLVATLVASWLLLSPLDLIRVADDAIASALSVGNIRFAAQATDYFAAGEIPSPFLHYWSLGVEEQFYLLWPALLIVATRLPRPRLATGIVLVAVLLSSFGASLYLTDVSQSWAFYSLPTRAWQLALGGLLAVLATRPRTSPEAGALDGDNETPPAVPLRLADLGWAALGWAGLAAIIGSVVVIDGLTPYPGVASLGPTLGAAAVIAAGDRRFSPAAILVLAPMRFIGRISFSLYLVHWPILVLPAAGLAIGEELPIEERLGLAAFAIVVAFVCYRFVELPVHRGRLLAMRPGRTLAMAGATIVATAVIAVGVGSMMSRELDGSGTEDIASIDPGEPVASPGLEVAIGPDTLPGVGLEAGQPVEPDPSDEPPTSYGSQSSTEPDPSNGGAGPVPAGVAPAASAGGTAKPTSQPAPSATPRPLLHPKGPQPLPANVKPSLVRASNDWEEIERNNCTLSEREVKLTNCVYGNPKGTYLVALVGDSKASQWFPAVERIAVEHGWRLIPFTKLACRFVDMPIYSRTLKREFTECERWRELVVAKLKDLKPDLVLVSSGEGMGTMVAADNNPTRQGVAMARFLKEIPGQIGVIVDNPWSNFDVPACISRHRNDVTACETSRADAYKWRFLKLETAATKASGATLIDMSTAICPWDPCPVVLNRMIVYRDVFHLTATFARSLAPVLEARLPKPAAVAQK